MEMYHAASMTSSSIDPFQELANAVIVRAAEDYRILGKMLYSRRRVADEEHVKHVMESIRRFFLGEWFCLLSAKDNGAVILKLLDEEVLGDD